MIASVHIADVSRRELAAAVVRGRRPRCAGLIYGRPLITAPLGGELLATPSLTRLAFAAFWTGEDVLESFLGDDLLGARLGNGWHVRLLPTHLYGRWHALTGTLGPPVQMSEQEPAAVLTIGRLRLREIRRFLRASAAAEELALANPELVAATGLALPPGLVATFSLWRTTAGMRRYADGTAGAAHRAAVLEHTARPFHHESAFIRFRPLSVHGSLPGWEPVSALVRSPVAAS